MKKYYPGKNKPWSQDPVMKNNHFFRGKNSWDPPSSVDRGSSQVLFEPYDPSRFMGTQPSSACDQRHPHGQSTDAWRKKKLTPKDDTPYNVGPKKGQWFLEGWNLSPPKTDEITSVTNFDKYKLYDRPFLKGVGQPTWWKPNSKFINRNFPTLFAPKALGNVHLPKKDDFSGDFYESC